jgi:hypothetical protein
MFTSEQKIFIVQCYFRNGESSYSTPLVFDEFQQKFPDFQALTHLQWRVKKTDIIFDITVISVKPPFLHLNLFRLIVTVYILVVNNCATIVSKINYSLGFWDIRY